MKDIGVHGSGIPNSKLKLGKGDGQGKVEPSAEKFAEHLKQQSIENQEKQVKQDKERREKREKEDDETKLVIGREEDEGKFDMSHLLLYKIPYVDPSTLSISLRQALHLDRLLCTDSRIVKRRVPSKPQVLRTDENLQIVRSRKDDMDIQPKGDPFAVFRNIDTTLKEIAKTERTTEAKIVKQLVEKLDVSSLKNGHEVRIELAPSILGQTAIQVVTQGDTVQAIIKTTSRVTYNEVRESEEELKQMLEGRGLKVNKVVVILVEQLEEEGFKER